MAERVVVDASAMVDLLVGSPVSDPLQRRLRGCELHAPGHFDAEVLSALGRLHRAGHLSSRQAKTRIDRLAAAPVDRYEVARLVAGAWRLRHNLRLVDALYVELANRLDLAIVTTDAGMAATAPSADLVSAS